MSGNERDDSQEPERRRDAPERQPETAEPVAEVTRDQDALTARLTNVRIPLGSDQNPHGPTGVVSFQISPDGSANREIRVFVSLRDALTREHGGVVQVAESDLAGRLQAGGTDTTMMTDPATGVIHIHSQQQERNQHIALRPIAENEDGTSQFELSYFRREQDGNTVEYDSSRQSSRLLVNGESPASAEETISEINAVMDRFSDAGGVSISPMALRDTSDQTPPGRIQAFPLGLGLLIAQTPSDAPATTTPSGPTLTAENAATFREALDTASGREELTAENRQQLTAVLRRHVGENAAPIVELLLAAQRLPQTQGEDAIEQQSIPYEQRSNLESAFWALTSAQSTAEERRNALQVLRNFQNSGPLNPAFRDDLISLTAQPLNNQVQWSLYDVINRPGSGWRTQVAPTDAAGRERYLEGLRAYLTLNPNNIYEATRGSNDPGGLVTVLDSIINNLHLSTNDGRTLLESITPLLPRNAESHILNHLRRRAGDPQADAQVRTNISSLLDALSPPRTGDAARYQYDRALTPAEALRLELGGAASIPELAAQWEYARYDRQNSARAVFTSVLFRGEGTNPATPAQIRERLDQWLQATSGTDATRRAREVDALISSFSDRAREGNVNAMRGLAAIISGVGGNAQLSESALNRLLSATAGDPARAREALAALNAAADGRERTPLLTSALNAFQVSSAVLSGERLSAEMQRTIVENPTQYMMTALHMGASRMNAESGRELVTALRERAGNRELSDEIRGRALYSMSSLTRFVTSEEMNDLRYYMDQPARNSWLRHGAAETLLQIAEGRGTDAQRHEALGIFARHGWTPDVDGRLMDLVWGRSTQMIRSDTRNTLLRNPAFAADAAAIIWQAASYGSFGRWDPRQPTSEAAWRDLSEAVRTNPQLLRLLVDNPRFTSSQASSAFLTQLAGRGANERAMVLDVLSAARQAQLQSTADGASERAHSLHRLSTDVIRSSQTPEFVADLRDRARNGDAHALTTLLAVGERPSGLSATPAEQAAADALVALAADPTMRHRILDSMHALPTGTWSRLNRELYGRVLALEFSPNESVSATMDRINSRWLTSDMQESELRWSRDALHREMMLVEAARLNPGSPRPNDQQSMDRLVESARGGNERAIDTLRLVGAGDGRQAESARQALVAMLNHEQTTAAARGPIQEALLSIARGGHYRQELFTAVSTLARTNPELAPLAASLITLPESVPRSGNDTIAMLQRSLTAGNRDATTVLEAIARGNGAQSQAAISVLMQVAFAARDGVAHSQQAAARQALLSLANISPAMRERVFEEMSRAVAQSTSGTSDSALSASIQRRDRTFLAFATAIVTGRDQPTSNSAALTQLSQAVAQGDARALRVLAAYAYRLDSSEAGRAFHQALTSAQPLTRARAIGSEQHEQIRLSMANSGPIDQTRRALAAERDPVQQQILLNAIRTMNVFTRPQLPAAEAQALLTRARGQGADAATARLLLSSYGSEAVAYLSPTNAADREVWARIQLNAGLADSFLGWSFNFDRMHDWIANVPAAQREDVRREVESAFVRVVQSEVQLNQNRGAADVLTRLAAGGNTYGGRSFSEHIRQEATQSLLTLARSDGQRATLITNAVMERAQTDPGNRQLLTVLNGLPRGDYQHPAVREHLAAQATALSSRLARPDLSNEDRVAALQTLSIIAGHLRPQDLRDVLSRAGGATDAAVRNAYEDLMHAVVRQGTPEQQTLVVQAMFARGGTTWTSETAVRGMLDIAANQDLSPRTRAQARALLLSALDTTAGNLPQEVRDSVRATLTGATNDAPTRRALVTDAWVLSGASVNGLTELARSMPAAPRHAMVTALLNAYRDGVTAPAVHGQTGLQRTTNDVARAIDGITGGIRPITNLLTSNNANERMAGVNLLAASAFSAGLPAERQTAALTAFEQALRNPELRVQGFQALNMVPGEMTQRLPYLAQLASGSAVRPATPEQAVNSLSQAGRSGNLFALQALTAAARENNATGTQALNALVETAGSGADARARQAAQLMLQLLAGDPDSGARTWQAVTSALATRPALLDSAVAMASQGMLNPRGPLQSLAALEQLANAGNARALEVLQIQARGNTETARGAAEITARVALNIPLTAANLGEVANMVLERRSTPSGETPAQLLEALTTAARNGNARALQMVARISGMNDAPGTLARDAATSLLSHAATSDAAREAVLTAASRAFSANSASSGAQAGFLPSVIINTYNRQFNQAPAAVEAAALRTFIDGLQAGQFDQRIAPMLAWLGANQPDLAQRAMTLLRSVPEAERSEVMQQARAVFEQQINRLQQSFANFQGPPAERGQLLQQYYALLQSAASLNGNNAPIASPQVLQAMRSMNVEQQNFWFNSAPALMRLAAQPQSATREDAAILQALNASRRVEGALSDAQQNSVRQFIESRMLSVLTNARTSEAARDTFEGLNRSGWSSENNTAIRNAMRDFSRAWLTAHPQDANILQQASLLGHTEGPLPVRAWLRQMGIEVDGGLLERAIARSGEQGVRDAILSAMRFNSLSPAMRAVVIGDGYTGIPSTDMPIAQLQARLREMQTTGASLQLPLGDVMQYLAGERNANEERIRTVLNGRVDLAGTQQSITRLIEGLRAEITRLETQIAPALENLNRAAQNGNGFLWTQSDQFDRSQRLDLEYIATIRRQQDQRATLMAEWQQELENLQFNRAVSRYHEAVGLGRRDEADRAAFHLLAPHGAGYMLVNAPQIFRDIFPAGMEQSSRGALERLHQNGSLPIPVPSLSLGSSQVWRQSLERLRESSNANWGNTPSDVATRGDMAQYIVSGLQTDPRYRNVMQLTTQIATEFQDLQNLYQIGAADGNARSPAFTENIRRRADSLYRALHELSNNDYTQMLQDTRRELATLRPGSPEHEALNNVRLFLEQAERLSQQFNRGDSALRRMFEQIRSGAFNASTFGEWLRTTGVDLLIEGAIIAGCIAFTGGAGLAVRGAVSAVRAAAIMTAYMRAGNIVASEVGHMTGNRIHGSGVGDLFRSDPWTNSAISGGAMQTLRPRSVTEALTFEGTAAAHTFGMNLAFMGLAPVLHNIPGVSNLSAGAQRFIPRLAPRSAAEVAQGGVALTRLQRIGVEFAHQFEGNLHFGLLQMPLGGAIEGMGIHNEYAAHMASGLIAAGHGRGGAWRFNQGSAHEPVMQHTYRSNTEIVQNLRREGHQVVRHNGHDYLIVPVPNEVRPAGSTTGSTTGSTASGGVVTSDGTRIVRQQVQISAETAEVLRRAGIEVTQQGGQHFASQVPVRIEQVSTEAFYRGLSQVTGGWGPEAPVRTTETPRPVTHEGATPHPVTPELQHTGHQGGTDRVTTNPTLAPTSGANPPLTAEQLTTARASLGVQRTELQRQLDALTQTPVGNSQPVRQHAIAALESQIRDLTQNISQNLQQSLNLETVRRRTLERQQALQPTDLQLQQQLQEARARERSLEIAMHLELGLLPPTLEGSPFRVRDTGLGAAVLDNLPLFVIGSMTPGPAALAVLEQLRLNRNLPRDLTLTGEADPRFESGSHNANQSINLTLVPRLMQFGARVVNEGILSGPHNYNHEIGHNLQMVYFDRLPQQQREQILNVYRSSVEASGMQWMRQSPLWEGLMNGQYFNHMAFYHINFPEMFAEMHAMHRLNQQLGGDRTYQQLLAMRTARYQPDRAAMMERFEGLYQTLRQQVFEPFDRAGRPAGNTPAGAAGPEMRTGQPRPGASEIQAAMRLNPDVSLADLLSSGHLTPQQFHQLQELTAAAGNNADARSRLEAVGRSLNELRSQESIRQLADGILSVTNREEHIQYVEQFLRPHLELISRLSGDTAPQAVRTREVLAEEFLEQANTGPNPAITPAAFQRFVSLDIAQQRQILQAMQHNMLSPNHLSTVLTSSVAPEHVLTFSQALRSGVITADTVNGLTTLRPEQRASIADLIGAAPSGHQLSPRALGGFLDLPAGARTELLSRLRSGTTTFNLDGFLRADTASIVASMQNLGRLTDGLANLSGRSVGDIRELLTQAAQLRRGELALLNENELRGLIGIISRTAIDRLGADGTRLLDGLIEAVSRRRPISTNPELRPPSDQRMFPSIERLLRMITPSDLQGMSVERRQQHLELIRRYFESRDIAPGGLDPRGVLPLTLQAAERVVENRYVDAIDRRTANDVFGGMNHEQVSQLMRDRAPYLSMAGLHQLFFGELNPANFRRDGFVRDGNPVESGYGPVQQMYVVAETTEGRALAHLYARTTGVEVIQLTREQFDNPNFSSTPVHAVMFDRVASGDTWAQQRNAGGRLASPAALQQFHTGLNMFDLAAVSASPTGSANRSALVEAARRRTGLTAEGQAAPLSDAQFRSIFDLANAPVAERRQLTLGSLLAELHSRRQPQNADQLARHWQQNLQDVLMLQRVMQMTTTSQAMSGMQTLHQQFLQNGRLGDNVVFVAINRNHPEAAGGRRSNLEAADSAYTALHMYRLANGLSGTAHDGHFPTEAEIQRRLAAGERLQIVAINDGIGSGAEAGTVAQTLRERYGRPGVSLHYAVPFGNSEGVDRARQSMQARAGELPVNLSVGRSIDMLDNIGRVFDRTLSPDASPLVQELSAVYSVVADHLRRLLPTIHSYEYSAPNTIPDALRPLIRALNLRGPAALRAERLEGSIPALASDGTQHTHSLNTSATTTSTPTTQPRPEPITLSATQLAAERQALLEQVRAAMPPGPTMAMLAQHSFDNPERLRPMISGNAPLLARYNAYVSNNEAVGRGLSWAAEQLPAERIFDAAWLQRLPADQSFALAQTMLDPALQQFAVRESLTMLTDLPTAQRERLLSAMTTMSTTERAALLGNLMVMPHAERLRIIDAVPSGSNPTQAASALQRAADPVVRARESLPGLAALNEPARNALLSSLAGNPRAAERLRRMTAAELEEIAQLTPEQRQNLVRMFEMNLSLDGYRMLRETAPQQLRSQDWTREGIHAMEQVLFEPHTADRVRRLLDMPGLARMMEAMNGIPHQYRSDVVGMLTELSPELRATFSERLGALRPVERAATLEFGSRMPLFDSFLEAVRNVPANHQAAAFQTMWYGFEFRRTIMRVPETERGTVLDRFTQFPLHQQNVVVEVLRDAPSIARPRILQQLTDPANARVASALGLMQFDLSVGRMLDHLSPEQWPALNEHLGAARDPLHAAGVLGAITAQFALGPETFNIVLGDQQFMQQIITHATPSTGPDRPMLTASSADWRYRQILNASPPNGIGIHVWNQHTQDRAAALLVEMARENNWFGQMFGNANAALAERALRTYVMELVNHSGEFSSHNVRVNMSTTAADASSVYRHEIRHFQQAVDLTAIRQVDPVAFSEAILNEVCRSLGTGQPRGTATQFDLSESARRSMETLLRDMVSRGVDARAALNNPDGSFNETYRALLNELEGTNRLIGLPELRAELDREYSFYFEAMRASIIPAFAGSAVQQLIANRARMYRNIPLVPELVQSVIEARYGAGEPEGPYRIGLSENGRRLMQQALHDAVLHADPSEAMRLPNGEFDPAYHPLLTEYQRAIPGLTIHGLRSAVESAYDQYQQELPPRTALRDSPQFQQALAGLAESTVGRVVEQQPARYYYGSLEEIQARRSQYSQVQRNILEHLRSLGLTGDALREAAVQQGQFITVLTRQQNALERMVREFTPQQRLLFERALHAGLAPIHVMPQVVALPAASRGELVARLTLALAPGRVMTMAERQQFQADFVREVTRLSTPQPAP